MKTEDQAWQSLREHAASQLRPGFADRVLRAAAKVAPSLAGQFALSAVTAALCLIAVFVYYAQDARAGDSQGSLAGWQQIASATDDPGLAQQ